MRHAIDMSMGEILVLVDELQELAWASDYDDENNVLEFSARKAEEMEPTEFSRRGAQVAGRCRAGSGGMRTAHL